MEFAFEYVCGPGGSFEQVAAGKPALDALRRWRLANDAPRDAVQLFTMEYAHTSLKKRKEEAQGLAQGSSSPVRDLYLYTEGLRSCCGCVVIVPGSFLGLAHVQGGINYAAGIGPDFQLAGSWMAQSQVIPLINKALQKTAPEDGDVLVLLTHGYRRQEACAADVIKSKVEGFIEDSAAHRRNIRLLTPDSIFRRMSPTDTLHLSGGVYLRWSPDACDEVRVVVTLRVLPKATFLVEPWDNSRFGYTRTEYRTPAVHPGDVSPNCGIMRDVLHPLNKEIITMLGVTPLKAWSLDLDVIKDGAELAARRLISAKVFRQAVMDSGRFVEEVSRDGSKSFKVQVKDDEVELMNAINEMQTSRLS